MPGARDRLDGGKPEPDRGLSALDLTGLSPNLLSVMRLVLRAGESATYRANFARRGGHVLDSEPGPARRETTVTMKGIWGRLDDSEKG